MAPGTAGVEIAAAVEVEHRPVALVALDVRRPALGRVEGAGREVAVLIRGGAGHAHHPVEHRPDVIGPALVGAGVDVDLPLGVRRGQRLLAQELVIGADQHLGDHRGDHRDAERRRVDPRRADRGAVVGAGDRAGLGIEAQLPRGAADHAHVLGDRDHVEDVHDAAAPAGERQVDRADLRRGALVGEGEDVALLAHVELDRVDAAVAGHRDLLVLAVAPFAVGDLRQQVFERLLGRVEQALHHALDRGGAVLVDQAEHPLAGGVVAGDRRPQVERQVDRGPRLAAVDALQLGVDLAVADHPARREAGRVEVDVLGVRAEGAGDGAADVVHVGGVDDPAEQLALDEDRAEEVDVGLVGGPDPGVVAHPHVALGDVFAVFFHHVGDHVIHPAGEVLDAEAEEEELTVLGADRRLVVAAFEHDRRDREVLDRLEVLLVQVPEVVADDLEGDRVGDDFGVGVELQPRRDLALGGRDVGVLEPVPESLRADD